jgi:hypothetical protein
LDVQFMSMALELKPTDIPPMVLRLDQDTLLQELTHPRAVDYAALLKTYPTHTSADLTLLEGPGDLQEGILFGLSLPELAQHLQAQVLLISRYHSALIVESLLAAHKQLPNCLAGVLINDVPEDQLEIVRTVMAPFLEQQGIPVLGILPSNRILRSIGVGELVNQLEAEILCCPDRMDVLVEDFVIGAMNVNSALKYFRKSDHKAVITGGDRTDIQLAALETYTLCLILTGKLPLDRRVRSRAEELEVPILSVDLDTFATIKRIERVFGQVRLHEAVKVSCIQELMSRNFDFPRLYASLGLAQPVVSSVAQ